MIVHPVLLLNSSWKMMVAALAHVAPMAQTSKPKRVIFLMDGIMISVGIYNLSAQPYVQPKAPNEMIVPTIEIKVWMLALYSVTSNACLELFLR